MQTMNTYAIINGFTDQVHDTREGLRDARISRDFLNAGKGWRRKDGGDNRRGNRRFVNAERAEVNRRESVRRQNERRQPMRPQPGKGFHLARPGGWRT